MGADTTDAPFCPHCGPLAAPDEHLGGCPEVDDDDR